MIAKIKNLTTTALVGVYEFELQKKQKIIINLEIDYDAGVAPETDKIEDCMNYHPICDGVKKLVSDTKYELIEKICNEVGKYVLSYDKVRSVKVEIDKPEAPIEGIESVSVSDFYRK